MIPTGSVSKEKKITIAMAWWWTWGHVFPIKSLLDFLAKRPVYAKNIKHVYRFGSPQGLEARICNELSLPVPLDFVSILSGKYRRETKRSSRFKNIRDIFLFGVGFFQALFRLIRYDIDVVFCKGGFVALPVVLAATLLQRQIIVHESDTHPGLVNKIASRFSTKVFTGFDKVLHNAKTIGQIISDEVITEQKEPISPQKKSLFDAQSVPHKPKVLVVGGSQWSRGLYSTMIDIFAQHPEVAGWFEFYIILGLLNQEMLTQFAKFPNVHIKGFLTQQEMGSLYNLCDIAITRGGTTSLAEQKLYDMKQIIIPIPWTHDQYDNAQRYVDHHQDIMINQRDKGFEINILNALIKLRTFIKKPQKKDKQLLVAYAKDAIWKSILK